MTSSLAVSIASKTTSKRPQFMSQARLVPGFYLYNWPTPVSWTWHVYGTRLLSEVLRYRLGSVCAKAFYLNEACSVYEEHELYGWPMFWLPAANEFAHCRAVTAFQLACECKFLPVIWWYVYHPIPRPFHFPCMISILLWFSALQLWSCYQLCWFCMRCIHWCR